MIASPFLSAALLAGVAYAAARRLIEPACRLLARGGMVARNFRKDVIPTGAGIVVPLAALPSVALFGARELASLWLLMLFGVALLGFVDDAAGRGEHGGFGGHLRALRSGRLTTGAVKALFGGALALYAGWALHGRFGPALLSGTVIALSTNAVNLLDVVPGRAIKGAFALAAAGFALLAAAGSPFAWSTGTALIALAPFGAALALLPGDLRARYMLGDAGANALGMSAGMTLAALPPGWQGAALLGLVMLHAVSERRSLSSLIEENPLLGWLDRLGRP